jgi:hypothetical protein
MTIKANGRSLLIIAAGIWMCVSGPVQAAPDADGASGQAVKVESTEWAGHPVVLHKFAKHAPHLRKKHASLHRKSHHVAWKSSRRKQLAAPETTMDEGNVPSTLPPAVANANAELSTDTSAGDASAMSTRASANLQMAAEPEATDTQASEQVDNGVVEADQLNDVDRALAENSAPAPLMTMAAANAPATAAPSVQATASTEETAWSQSSIIGKIFIAFGGLLTLASAARMFMA